MSIQSKVPVFLHSDNNQLLILDQPEDDLDNSYIYTTLTKSFKELKGKRQLILSTHNANLPVDLTLDFDKKPE